MERGELALKAFEGDPRQDTLAIIWPELHDALAGVGEDAADRPLVCATARHAAPGLIGPRPLAVGRVQRNGAPACRPCVDHYGDGTVWPLRTLAPGGVADETGEIQWPVLTS